MIQILLLLIGFQLCIAENPIFPGYYADPEGIVYGDKYWIYPTYSAEYENQTFFDAFSSYDMVNWTKHSRIIDTNEVTWADKAMWAPAVLRKSGKYYFFFGANDVLEVGGIGVAVSDQPEGPYKDLLRKPLINEIVNGAQPIDQFVFTDVDGQMYMYYGGWGHCNMVKMSEDLTNIIPFPDGQIYKEITPQDYVEGPFMFIRNGIYYFMWSEGGWGLPNYRVAYAMATSAFGPFERLATILEQDEDVATGAGHHSVIQVPGQDKYYIVYHRRPLGDNGRDSRVTCVDEMKFNDDGTIIPVKMTFDGVIAPLLSGSNSAMGKVIMLLSVSNSAMGKVIMLPITYMFVCMTALIIK